MPFLVEASLRADSPLAQLADRAAAEVVRTSGGAVVELPPTEDRTGRGLAADLHALILARLKGRVPQATSGPRLRIASVVSETPGRLSFSARVVDEPQGHLVDLLSVSVSFQGADLVFAPVRPVPAEGGSLEVTSSHRTPPLGARVLDLAFLGADRLVLLFSDEVALYRWTTEGLALSGRRALPLPHAPVRSPGGLLVVIPKEDAFWALTSRASRAALFAIEGTKLMPRQEAEAVPLPAAPQGLRYRIGTNLLEGSLADLGPGPFLDVEATSATWALGPDGRILCPDCGASGARGGRSLASVWDRFAVTSSPSPPDGDDHLVVYEETPSRLEPRLRLAVEGAVGAVGARIEGKTARIVAAVESPNGSSHLLVVDLSRP